jgi:hypothetical protein
VVYCIKSVSPLLVWFAIIHIASWATGKTFLAHDYCIVKLIRTNFYAWFTAAKRARQQLGLGGHCLTPLCSLNIFTDARHTARASSIDLIAAVWYFQPTSALIA